MSPPHPVFKCKHGEVSLEHEAGATGLVRNWPKSGIWVSPDDTREKPLLVVVISDLIMIKGGYKKLQTVKCLR